MHYSGTNSLTTYIEGMHFSLGTHEDDWYDYEFMSAGYMHIRDNYVLGASVYMNTEDVYQGAVYGSYSFGTTTLGTMYTRLEDDTWDYESDVYEVSLAYLHNIGNFYVRGAVYGEYLVNNVDVDRFGKYLSVGAGYNYGNFSTYASIRGESDLYGVEGIGTAVTASYQIDRINLSAMYYRTDRDLLTTDLYGVSIGYLF